MESLATCPNCNTEVTGPYCATCGQEHKNLNRYIWTLTGELLDDVLRVDSRAARSLFAIFFRPGFLTTEYFAGRRMRYVPPIRFYLIISFLFFFILPLLSGLDSNPEEVVIVNGDDPVPTDWRQEVRDGDFQLSLGSWLTEEENKALNEKFKAQVNKLLDRSVDDASGIIGEFMDLMSAVMFFLLPVFAIFMKLFYIGSGVYYAEHLLLTVHNHCFLFLAMLLSSVLALASGTFIAPVTVFIDDVLHFWIPIYMFLSMKHTFDDGWFLTLFKFVMLSSCYLVLAILGVVTAGIAGIMMA